MDNPNPVPSVASVTPGDGFTADAASQASAQTLTIDGSNFIATTSVLWDGMPLSGVAVVSASQLTVPVPPSDLQTSGTARVVVSNPAPGGGSSNPVMVKVNPPTPAAPGLAPLNTTALSGGFELAVTASNVLYNSVVVWNAGTPNATFLNTHLTSAPGASGSAGTLTAVVPNRLIAAAGAVPVGIANPNADGSISAAVSPDANFTIGAPATTACLLAGAGKNAPQYRNYAFVATGSDTSGAASMVGSFRIDDTGALVNAPLPNIVNSFADFKDRAHLFALGNGGNGGGRMSGAAGSCLDSAGVPGVGKVQFTVAGIPGDTFTLNYTLRAVGNFARITLTDTLYGLHATGQMQIQYNPNAFNQGSFAFGLVGENAAAARYAVVGAMCTSAPVFMQADFNDSAAPPSTATAGGWSLVPGDATTGRNTTSLSFSNGRTLNLTVYGVGGGKAYAMESSPIATSSQVLSGVITGFRGQACLATGKGGGFDNHALSNAVFGVTSQGGGNALAVLGAVNHLAPAGGGGCGAGQGAATLIEDDNVSGTHGTIAPTPACYAVSAQGRAVLTFNDPRTHSASGGTFYLDGAGNGYLIGQGKNVPYGFVALQPSPLPAIGGGYGVAPLDFPGGLLPVTSVAIDAASAASGTLTDNANGNTTVMPYARDAASGRGTALMSSATTFGDTQVAFYELSAQQLYFIDQTSATPVIGILIQ
jgi:IPT/TIG domain